MNNQTPIPSIAVIPTVNAISRDFDIEGFAVALTRIARKYVELIGAKPN